MFHILLTMSQDSTEDSPNARQYATKLRWKYSSMRIYSLIDMFCFLVKLLRYVFLWLIAEMHKCHETKGNYEKRGLAKG